ncbi:MAG: hypothetical protein ACE5ER_02155 [Nitrospinaceae bacterium]
MEPGNRCIHLTCRTAWVLIWVLQGAAAWALPTGEAWEQKQGASGPVYETYQDNPALEGVPPLLHEMEPGLTDLTPPEHPYPEYMKKFLKGTHGFPAYYQELLEVPPVDQVQSKVFDPKAFRGIRRIGVTRFENKTKGPGKDENAGFSVAEQLWVELHTGGRYLVISPKQMVEEYRMKIITTPAQRKNSGAQGMPPAARQTASAIDGGPAYDLPYSAGKMDAVLIGAVTRYSNIYYDRLGQPQQSPAVAMEFGAFLISTRTGKAIWGARFVGSQHPSLRNLKFWKLRWLSKREFTQQAVRRVLKDFSQIRLNPEGDGAAPQ